MIAFAFIVNPQQVRVNNLQHPFFLCVLSRQILFFSICRQPSMLGPTLHDLSHYQGLELELRGDGRSYILNIQTGFDESLFNPNPCSSQEIVI